MTNQPGADLHLPEGRRAGQSCVKLLHYWRAMWGIIGRELWRFVTQRERFISALVRPLVWLFVFAAGFRAALGLAITPPYETYILYEVYPDDHLIVLHKGRIKANGTVDDILKITHTSMVKDAFYTLTQGEQA